MLPVACCRLLNWMSVVALCALAQPLCAQEAGSPITILPMGDSITAGVDYSTFAEGGYRDPLLRNLIAAGVAARLVGPTAVKSSAFLAQHGSQRHCGFGGYRIDQLRNNLDGNDGTAANMGGFWMTGGNGTDRAAIVPDVVLLQIGGNDILRHFDSQTANPSPEQFIADMQARLVDLVAEIHRLAPKAVILVASIPPLAAVSAQQCHELDRFNAFIKTELVPGLAYTRFVDNCSFLKNPDGSVNTSLYGADNIHPNRFGLAGMALNWSAAIRELVGASASGQRLSVEHGSGDGVYPAGTVVLVQADAPAPGQQFAGWSPAGSAWEDPFVTPALFTMPGQDVSLTATTSALGTARLPEGRYRLVSLWDQLALAAGDVIEDAAVQQQVLTEAATQHWELRNLDGGEVMLTLPSLDLALAVPDGATDDGKPLVMARASGAANQRWTITFVASGCQLLNVQSGKALTVGGYNNRPGAQMVQFATSNAAMQQCMRWAFFPLGE